MDHPSLASAASGHRHLFIRDLVLMAHIGVHRHEHDAAQRVRINLDLAIDDPDAGSSRTAISRDELGGVVDYDRLADKARRIATTGHINLVETLAERLSEACLQDARVAMARVRVEKLDVFSDAASAGIEIERRRR